MVYAYNFVKTTAASDATSRTLELLSVYSPRRVTETDIIPALPHAATYHPFTISKEGIGEMQHQLALERHVATTVLRELKRTTSIITPDIEQEVLSSVLGDVASGPDINVDVMFISFHESTCHKQFFAFARLYYPKLDVQSEDICSGKFHFSRFSLSQEDTAMFDLCMHFER